MIPGRAEAVAVGASAGALEALSAILPGLPADYPLPVFVVVHLPPDRDSLMARLLQDSSRIKVREAEDKEAIEPGTVYLAPPDYHLLIEPDRRLSLSGEEPVLFSRPSIDVMFETAAEAYGPGLVGVVLTGANSDGARGLRAIRAAGGTVLVQRPDAATSSAMPRAALDACPEALALTLQEIAEHLRGMVEPPDERRDT
jgi:two-component system chemotaxis response regulator CheB